MPLTADQLTAAKTTLEDLLNPLKSEGARVNLTPVLQGPYSKGEFQIYYEGGSGQPPTQLTFNAAYSQLYTRRFRAFVILKDMRDPWAALPILEQSKSLIEGVQLFGEQPRTDYEGGLHVTADQFVQDRQDSSVWTYQFNAQCQIEEAVRMPYEPSN